MDIILFLPFFIAAIFLAFYVPGRVILGNQKNLSKLGIFAVSIILGLVLWGWQGYIFGFLNARWLSYLYLLGFLVVFVKQKYYSFKIPKIHPRKLDWITLGIVVVGIFGQVIPFLRNGQITSLGLFVGEFNNIDHIWHVTLVEEFVKRFPPFEPGMYGIPLLNYHFWFNLVTGELVRVFHLPIFSTQFVGMYPLAAILLGIIGYVFAASIYNSKFFIRLFLFLLFFSSDAIIWFFLFIKHELWLTMGGGFEDATKFMDAPGRGMATLICLAILLLLYKNKDQINRKNIFIIGLLTGSIMGFKVYFGIPFMFGLFCLSFYSIFKKSFSYFWILLVSSIFFLGQFLPFNATSGGLFLLPFEVPRSFIGQLLPWVDQRWRIYRDHSNYIRLVEYGVLMTLAYFFANLGIKLLGIIPLRRTVKLFGVPITIFLYSTLFISGVLGLFFYQKIGGANIWEFFLAGSLILAITVSLNISLLLANKNKIIKGVVITILLVLIIPRWLNSVHSYLQRDYFSGFHGISKTEIQVYDYLKNNTPEKSLILVVNQTSYVNFSSIVSVLTERDLFYSGPGVSQKFTPEMIKRKQDLEEVITSLDVNKVNSILKNDKIDYVFVYKKPVITGVILQDKELKKVFSNNEADILKVNLN